jgi:hypothetical protein
MKYLMYWHEIGKKSVFLNIRMHSLESHIILFATTQPTIQNNLKQLLLGWYYYLLKKNPQPHHHHTTTPGLIKIRTVLGNLGSWYSVCNLNLTKLDEIWKTTSIFSQIEDNLKMTSLFS